MITFPCRNCRRPLPVPLDDEILPARLVREYNVPCECGERTAIRWFRGQYALQLWHAYRIFGPSRARSF
jgi:hypothetical protein